MPGGFASQLYRPILTPSLHTSGPP